MRTLDAAIEHEKKVAKDKYAEGMLCHANPNDKKLDGCIECAREHEQLAELLEELKVYRETECNKSVYLASKSIDMIDAVNKGYAYGYNKAIDDFAEKLKAKEEELFEPDFGGMLDGSHERSFNNGILAMDEAIDEIAEQLKEGGENGNTITL